MVAGRGVLGGGFIGGAGAGEELGGEFLEDRHSGLVKLLHFVKLVGAVTPLSGKQRA